MIVRGNERMYQSDYSFTLEGVKYEKDKRNGRCYMLCDNYKGNLIKIRISLDDYSANLRILKSMLMI